MRFSREFVDELRGLASAGVGAGAGAAARPHGTLRCVGVAAHLWRCIRRARGLDGRTVTTMRVAVDRRSRPRRPRVPVRVHRQRCPVLLWARPAGRHDSGVPAQAARARHGGRIPRGGARRGRLRLPVVRRVRELRRGGCGGAKEGAKTPPFHETSEIQDHIGGNRIRPSGARHSCRGTGAARCLTAGLGWAWQSSNATTQPKPTRASPVLHGRSSPTAVASLSPNLKLCTLEPQPLAPTSRGRWSLGARVRLDTARQRRLLTQAAAALFICGGSRNRHPNGRFALVTAAPVHTAEEAPRRPGPGFHLQPTSRELLVNNHRNSDGGDPLEP